MSMVEESEDILAAPGFYSKGFKTRLGSRGSGIPGALALGGAYPAVISFIQDPVNDCVIAFSFPTKFFESISCFRL